MAGTGLASFILTFTLTLTLGQAKSEFRFQTVASLDNLLFLDGVLFDLSGIRSLGCARMCTNTKGCLTFTLHKGDQCRGHSIAMTTGNSREPSVGARTYVADDWLETPCSSDSDCPADINSQCFAGNCKCVPGYYYSTTTRICTAECAEADLQDTFLEYPDHVLLGYNLEKKWAVTPQACEERCVNYNTEGVICRSVEYLHKNLFCHIQNVTALDVDPSMFESVLTKTYFQRRCK